MKLSVKKGDNVKVIAGKDAGKTGEILEVNREKGRVVVANVNIQTHHKKPRSKDDKGGRIQAEGAIDVSNVQVVCPTCKMATRVAHSVKDGKNTRVCKKCGASLDTAKATKTTKSAKTATKSTSAKSATKTTKTSSAPKAEKTSTEKKTAKSSTKA